MNALRKALADYLLMRRSLGYGLVRSEKLLTQFLGYLEARGEHRVTSENALAWANLPASAHQSWRSYRLCAVRGFARHLKAFDPATEVPPAELAPWRACRATPYLYSDKAIARLMAAAGSLSTPHRAATYRTLIGLLAVSGMRAGEAVASNREDLDRASGVLTITNGKFGKSRELPLHESTVAALERYMRRPDRPKQAAKEHALFVSTAGTRLLYCNVSWTYGLLVARAGLKPRSASCRPRLHDIRHSFAVHTMLDSYRRDGDAAARLSLLSSYLGHVHPSHTYWYLSAAPELLSLASRRLERHLAGRS